VPLLRTTSLTVYEYLRQRSGDERIRYEYEAYVGLKKHGKKPHHAMFNRIWRLNELMEAGYDGWFLYIDSDAYIKDMRFDFYEYLSARGDKAFVFTSSGVTELFWDINDGVFMANLAHPVAKKIISEWAGYYNSYYSDEDWSKAVEWNDIHDDQGSLQKILSENDAHRSSFEITRGGDLFNYNGSIIGQYLRSFIFDRELSAAESTETMDVRLSNIKKEVDKILAANNSPYRT
jgi:hypothetical protein